jgi:hypothetical protein
MNDFSLWFITGMQHILDLAGYDHILFVSVLVISQPIENWSKILALITAFTLGHSVSLALSVIGIFRVSQNWIEFFIAFSILFSAVFTMFSLNQKKTQNNWLLFATVCFFGLIHGMGFSYLLRSMLGASESFVLPLLYFNLGLELGQLIIVLFVYLFSLLLTRLFKISHKIYKLIFVCLIGLISLQMCISRLLLLV